MSDAVPIPPPGFDSLSIDAKVDYVQSLWECISAKPEEVPVPDWHKEVIRDRLAAGTAAGRPWTELRAELLQKLRARR